MVYLKSNSVTARSSSQKKKHMRSITLYWGSTGSEVGLYSRTVIKRLSKVAFAVFAFFSLCCLSPRAASAEQPEHESHHGDNDRPNILFAIADDWGWPHAGVYGDPVVKTPTFDRVAKEGLLFKHAFISSPSCTPSRNAILTGQQFFRLGGGANLWSVLDTKHQSFVHLLGDAGYETGHMRKMWGPGNVSNWELNPAGRKFKNFQAFLDRRDASKPFCFCFGAFDPHRGYKEGSGKDSGMDLDKIKLFGCFPDSETIRSDVADYYFEVQRFDREVGAALKKLEELGELDNTVVVVTGDHGMPFPRCKSNLYDSGARVPMAVRWPRRIKAGRVCEEFVSTTDLAPTFLEAAGVEVPAAMTGKGWAPIFDDAESTDDRSFVIFGKERHVPAQEAPDYGGYPMRAIRTADFLLIENFRADRWPNGTPNYKKATIPYAWLGDTDNGPTKTYIVDHRDKDEAHRRSWELCFGKRPRLELYDVANDPEQLVNLAGDAQYKRKVFELSLKLHQELVALEDPRAEDSDAATEFFDGFKYLGSGPRHPSWKKEKGERR